MFSRFTLIECCKVNNLVNKRRSFDGAETPDSTPRSLWSHLATSASKACNFFLPRHAVLPVLVMTSETAALRNPFLLHEKQFPQQAIGGAWQTKVPSSHQKECDKFLTLPAIYLHIGEDFSVSSRSCRDPAHCFQLRAYRCTVFLGLHSLTWTP